MASSLKIGLITLLAGCMVSCGLQLASLRHQIDYQGLHSDLSVIVQSVDSQTNLEMQIDVTNAP